MTRDNFKLSDLLNTINYWQMTNLLHPAQPHFSTKLRDVIWNLIISRSGDNNFDELLRWAIVCYQSDDVIARFIKRIDDVDSTDSQGLTFLHLACFFNQASTVTALLSRGADPYKKDRTEKLALDYACANNHCGIVEELLENMEDKKPVHDLLLENAEKYSPEITQLLRNATHVQPAKFPLSKLAEFVQKHGVNKKKLEFKTNNHLIELTRPDTTSTEWEINLTVGESNQKKQKNRK